MKAGRFRNTLPNSVENLRASDGECAVQVQHASHRLELMPILGQQALRTFPDHDVLEPILSSNWYKQVLYPSAITKPEA